jgi:hypothetical protein
MRRARNVAGLQMRDMRNSYNVWFGKPEGKGKGKGKAIPVTGRGGL